MPSFFLQIHASSVSYTTAAPPSHKPVLLVKVGNGEYTVLQPPPDKDIAYFMDMDRGTLLDTITESKRFSKDMEGVALGQCKVYALTSMAKKLQPGEEKKAQVIEGAETLADVLGTPAGNVFLHITLVSPAVAAGE